MGIDPGFANIGISKLLFDPSLGYHLDGLEYIGTTKKDKKLGLREKADDVRRLGEIVKRFDEIVRKWPADVYAFEEVPSVRNSKNVRKIALGWGACYALASRKSDVVVLEYGPQDLKYVVTGNPQCSKKEMDEALSKRFQALAEFEIAESKREHIADATAAALKAAQDPAVLVLAKALKRVTS
jgi:Holliday junction resolvasome RuvABC endonuclease subunit